MQTMSNFCLWFLNNLPDFLMSEPICYFVAFFFLFVTVSLIKQIVNINK